MTTSPRAEPTHERTVRFVPLGGLGEIGMNCFALEQDGRILVVDCGICFPDDDVGVDVIHPDFSWLIERREALVGLFITHGHEDHIGAVPYLLRALGGDLEVFAPTHACALLGPRLVSHGLSLECLHEVSVRRPYPVGPFFVEPVAMAHSIVDATGLSIETSAGRIFHTGDFDFDEAQPAGSPTDEQRLGELGDAGVRLLLSDSTNVDHPERGGSEADVAVALRRLIMAEPHRVIVGMFSSNVHRLKALLEVAQSTGRKVCLLGRSLCRQAEAAEAIGRLQIPSSLFVSPERVSELPRREVLVLAGGSQAEGPSSLKRLSLGQHPRLAVEAGDCLVLSARIIPGNERPVLRMQNDFLRRGVVVRTCRTDPEIHVSGHAARSEQLRMIQLLRPQAFIPVHGTLHHLRAHARLAEEAGVPEVLVVENGTSAQVDADRPLRRGERVPSGAVQVAVGGQTLDSMTRRRRIDLGRNGLVLVSVAFDGHRALKGKPVVACYGVAGMDECEESVESMTRDIVAVFRKEGGGVDDLRTAITRAVRRNVVARCGARPLVQVSMVRL